MQSTQRAAQQAADLTKQMLGFARRQPLRTTTVDLNALVADALRGEWVAPARILAQAVVPKPRRERKRPRPDPAA